MNNREELMRNIMEYKFSINDLSLYLDTHPEDSNALKLHNNYVEIMKRFIKEYEENYGPLTFETVMDTWQWSEDKWPWERGYNE